VKISCLPEIKPTVPAFFCLFSCDTPINFKVLAADRKEYKKKSILSFFLIP